MDKLKLEFLSESFARLDRMEWCLAELRKCPEDPGLLAEIFRAVHTIKGTSGFLAYKRLARLAHAGEDVVGAVRSGRVGVTLEIIRGLVELMYALRVLVTEIAGTGTEGEPTSELDEMTLALLRQVLLAQGRESGRRATDCFGDHAGDVLVRQNRRTESNGLGEGYVMKMPDGPVSEHKAIAAISSVALRGQRTRRQIKRNVNAADLHVKAWDAQPLSSGLAHMPRMVRGLALTCHKSVRLVLTGQHLAITRSHLLAIKDPLLHALRNAVDHGIESPTTRKAAGKPEQGMIRLSAFHDQGLVVIELADDGAGIDLGRVRERAIEARYLSPVQSRVLSEREALQLAFMPGVSTVDTITPISGRGVGLDIVKNNIELVGGRVELDSRRGVGTVLRMYLPHVAGVPTALNLSTRGPISCRTEVSSYLVGSAVA